MSFKKKNGAAEPDTVGNEQEEQATPDIENESVPETAEPEETCDVTDEEPENPFEAELKKQKELYMRMAAEYDNFRKRSQREKDALSADVRADCVSALLPVIDNIERALSADNTSVESLLKGVEMIKSQTDVIFEKMGVSAFGDVGDLFDPQLHHCVSTAQAEDAESGTVTLVMQRGYRLGDKVIRPAMVQVAE